MEPLTKKTFKCLTKTEQVVMVIKSGKELLTRDDERYHIQLYLLSNLFTEIWYEQNKTTIVKISIPSKEKIIQNYNIDKNQVDQFLHN